MAVMPRGTIDQYVQVEGRPPNTWYRVDGNGQPIDADGYEIAIHDGGTLAEFFARAASDVTEEANESSRNASFKSEPDRIDLINRLRTATPAQVNSWIDTNVTSLAAARAVLKALVKVLALHIKT